MEAVLGIPKDGYNPFTDENEFTVDETRKLTIPEAIEFVLSIKKHEYTTGFTDFKSRFNMFSDWLLANKFENWFITAATCYYWFLGN